MTGRPAWASDAAERVFMTFAQASMSAVVVTRLTDATMWQGAAMAGGAAVLSMAKTVIARYTGTTDSASMIR